MRASGERSEEGTVDAPQVQAGTEERRHGTELDIHPPELSSLEERQRRGEGEKMDGIFLSASLSSINV